MIEKIIENIRNIYGNIWSGIFNYYIIKYAEKKTFFNKMLKNKKNESEILYLIWNFIINYDDFCLKLIEILLKLLFFI